MNPRTLRILAIAVVVLFAAVWLVNRQREAEPEANALLLPGLEDRLDEITAVTLTDEDGSTRIERKENGWVVPAKGGYPADTAKLRELLLGLAQGKKVEQKTANPELYGRIGVLDPTKAAGEKGKEDESEKSGVLVASEGLGDADFAVILGDSAQRDYRYVRVADEATSWLIDRNPDVPDEATGWLVRDITDLPASRVQSVTIRHADGETIHIKKDGEDADNFTVEDIPEGRKLSYASVANSIASALDNLRLDDVRPAGEAAGTQAKPDAAGDSSDDAGGKDADEDSGDETPEAVTTVFRTFDGLEVTVDSTGTDGETWISLHAAALPVKDTASDAAPAANGSGASDTQAEAGTAGEQDTAADEASDASAAESTDEGAGDEAAASGEKKEGEASADASGGDEAGKDAEKKPDPEAEAAEINARVAGWEYRIPQYKASQLRRHWEDLLSAPADDDEKE